MISFRPLLDLLGRLSPNLNEFSLERWEIGASEERFIPPARFLPGQLERIQATKFLELDRVLSDFHGGFEAVDGPTSGFLLRDVDLVDGVLYASSGVRHLRPRKWRRPAYVVPAEVTNGSLYESWWGNRWFGNWLSDDCPRYLLAERFGMPVTTSIRPFGHQSAYEAIIGITPRRFERVHFNELVVFEDFNKSHERQSRAHKVRTLLTSSTSYTTHPGVYLVRGNTGERRVLSNEAQIAERLSRERGFLVLDPSAVRVEEIIRACAGARVVAGVEGSHLVHGLAVMSPGTVLFVIQPPTRVTSVLKFVTDRQDLVYSFVVALGNHEEFSVAWEDVDRTLDLALKP
jgi:hypothetical protein